MSKKLSDIKIVYGENPQQACYGIDMLVSNDPLAIGNFELTQGENPSFCNITDLDRLLQTMTHIAAGYSLNTGKTPFIALGCKHGNCCGASIGEDRKKVVQNMLDGDLRAIFGGSIMLNFEVDEEIALELLNYNSQFGKRLLDMVGAPSFSDEAKQLLQRKNGKLRLFSNPALSSLGKGSLDAENRDRYIRGGHITQDNYTHILDFSSSIIKTNDIKVTEDQKHSLILAWAIAVTSNSNTMTLVKGSSLIANGVGQQDRVSAAELAVKRAGAANHDTSGSVAYGDSFFPFPDGPQVLVDAGVKVIFASSGSIKDDEVSQTLTDQKVAFLTHPDTHARGFAFH